MNRKSRFAAAAAIAASLALSAPAMSGTAGAAELTVAVSGVNSAEGRVYVALHRAAADVKFPDMKGAVAGAWRMARKGGFSVTFTELEPGRYAVNGFHDDNGNGDLDTNLLGIPTEGYGSATVRRQLRAAGFHSRRHCRERQDQRRAADRLLSLSGHDTGTDTNDRHQHFPAHFPRRLGGVRTGRSCTLRTGARRLR